VDAGADPGEVEVAGEAGDVVDVVEPAPREPTVLDRIQDELDDVERALERLDDGSYGTCQACSATIDDELLARRPTTRFCPEHDPAPAT